MRGADGRVIVRADGIGEFGGNGIVEDEGDEGGVSFRGVTAVDGREGVQEGGAARGEGRQPQEESRRGKTYERARI